MSASILSRPHIRALVAAGLAVSIYEHGFHWRHNGQGQSLHSGNADEVGQMLTDACVASVRYRYPNDTDDQLPGPLSYDWQTPYVHSAEWGQPARTPVAVLRALDCYEYQSCEHPGWEQSNAAAFCDRLRRMMIRRLPGYDEAPWSID